MKTSRLALRGRLFGESGAREAGRGRAGWTARKEGTRLWPINKVNVVTRKNARVTGYGIYLLMAGLDWNLLVSCGFCQEFQAGGPGESGSPRILTGWEINHGGARNR